MTDIRFSGLYSPYASYAQSQSALSLPMFQSSFGLSTQSPLASFLGASQSYTGFTPSFSNNVFSASSTGQPDFMQLLMLVQALKNRGPQRSEPSIIQQVATPTVTAATVPPPIPLPDPREAERAALLAQANDALQGGLFNTEALNNLKGKSAKQQYKETVAKAYNGGEKAGGKKKTTRRMVNDGTWKYNDWNLNELNQELSGKFGKMSKAKMKLQNIEATAATKATWHSTPFHMSQAQKYLNEAKKLEAYIQANGGTISSGSSPGTVSGSSPGATSSSTVTYSGSANLADLQAKAQELRDRAGLHFQIARTTMSPVIMDTDGNGKIDLTSVKDGVRFDLDGDGKKEQVAWTQAKGKDTDSWLSLDRNGNGQIDTGKELFGNQHGKANGYEELKQFDDNRDGFIDRKDAVYSKLKMWQDRNHDGISQADEMVGLDKAGVESVNLAYTESKATDAFGNELKQLSNFKRTDAQAQVIAQKQGVSFETAKTGLALDAWLQMSKAG